MTTTMKTDQQITLPERYAGCTPGPFRAAQAKYPVDGAYDWAILDAENRIIGEAFGRVGKEALRDAEANGRLFADAWTNAARVAELEACLRVLLDDIADMARKSEGVSGLNGNGVVPWETLLPGGKNDDWIGLDMATAEAVLAKGGV